MTCHLVIIPVSWSLSQVWSPARLWGQASSTRTRSAENKTFLFWFLLIDPSCELWMVQHNRNRSAKVKHIIVFSWLFLARCVIMWHRIHAWHQDIPGLPGLSGALRVGKQTDYFLLYRIPTWICLLQGLRLESVWDKGECFQLKATI